MTATIQIRPQGGPQEKFLSSSADIAIYGGAAGAGKTWAELIEPLRHIQTTKGFGAVIFRRTSPQIRNQGGLWDASATLYPSLGASPKESTTEWAFPPFGNRIKFTHLELEKHIHDHQGAEYPLICFDELTHFSRSQFFYLLSRNRSTCGVAPYTRATTNPDPDSWVRSFIDWWIGTDGLPIPAHSGKLRWFYRINDDMVWASTKQELTDKYGEQFMNPETGEVIPPLSVTFVAASIYDNKELLRKDPSYLAKLKSLPRVERERLLGGNWNVRAAAGDVFPRECFGSVEAMPASISKQVRAWDFAATKGGGDWTVGLGMAKGIDGYWYVSHVTRGQWDSNNVRQAVKNTAEQDGKRVRIRIPQDPGQAGKDQAQSFIRLLAGYVAKAVRPTGSKYDRAQPAAAQVQAGNVRLVRGKWNQAFLDELENFTGKDGETDDQVDAFADAFNDIEGAVTSKPNLRVL